MSEDLLNADVDRYLRAAALNTAPPPVNSDPLVGGATPVEQLLRVLGLVNNSGDVADDAEGIEGHAQRAIWTTETAGAFEGQDAGAAAQMNDTAAQQIPQIASGVVGALAGVVTGVLQPLGQIPQQFTQGAQQVMQAAAGLGGRSDGFDADYLEEPVADDGDDFGIGVEGLGGLGGVEGVGGVDGVGGVGSGAGGTVPTAVLGPAPVPSAGTHPSSAPFVPPPQAQIGTTTPPATAAMTGMPMVSPAGLQGAGVDRDPGNETKRVVSPPVHNGSPVQGRFATPSAIPAVTTRIDGRPVAARRIRTQEAAAD